VEVQLSNFVGTGDRCSGFRSYATATANTKDVAVIAMGHNASAKILHNKCLKVQTRRHLKVDVIQIINLTSVPTSTGAAIRNVRR
jgi:hypothetical protein